MANKRIITSDTWEDEFFASLSIFFRLLWFAVLTGCADDQGRFQDNLALIRSKAFPMDDIPLQQIEDGINAFEKAGKIVRYSINGKKIIQVANWWKHQTPRWAGKSKYPAPEGWTDRERYHGHGNEIIETNWKSKGGYLDGYIVSNTAANTTNDVNGDGDVNGEGEVGDPAASAAPPFSAGSRSADPAALKVFTDLTGMIVYPASETNKCEDAMNGLTLQHPQPQGLQEYLQPFWEEWKRRKYSKTNCAWLYDWAVSGEIPPDRRPVKSGISAAAAAGYSSA